MTGIPRLEVTFRIITPTFLAGADQAKAEMRATALKGLLRYWFRALTPEHVQGRKSPEAMLFGSHWNRIGQSRIHLMLEEKEPVYYSVSKSEEIQESALYHPHPGNQDWAYLDPDQTFTVSIYLRPNQKGTELEQTWKGVLASLWLMMQVGGIGSQSRRGFGTVQIERWEPVGNWPSQMMEMIYRFNEVQPESPQAYKNQWQKQWDLIRSWFRPRVGSHSSPYTLIGPSFQTYFSKQTFEAYDHAWEQANALFQKVKEDGRYAFGLPVVEGRYTMFPEKNSIFKRQVASPVRIRIPRLSTKKYLLQFSFLSAPYPQKIFKGKKVQISRGKYVKTIYQGESFPLDAPKYWKGLESILKKGFLQAGDGA